MDGRTTDNAPRPPGSPPSSAAAEGRVRGEGLLGLLVMAYGTPQSLDEVEPYYTHIRHGRPPTPELLQELIDRYKAIGGRSPLHEITEEQARRVAATVAERLGRPVSAFVGYLHAKPFIAEAVERLVGARPREAVALVMAPQYSAASVALYQQAAREALARHAGAPPVHFIDHFHGHPGFVAALARRVEATLAALPPDRRDGAVVVFTAHSIPQPVVDRGDPYPRHVEETAAKVAAAAGLQRWRVAYQSAGRTADPWLGPDVTDVIRELAREGARAVVACPVGFVADHLEVLYDLDIEARQVAEEAGVGFARTPSLNADRDFIEVLADLVLDRLGATRHEAAAAGARAEDGGEP
ncbi:ferrochelatase [Thermaerobacter sp. FW80]|uniref:ferrochelatase n=1 Tax=Thermaerobacter sp. FW80 TaxID=2546351 RepID=UPI0010756354|nr:ferrochelatase [Thermaerobacter sp. FW80]QBS37640.1 ferrochelatase [Thermaerobacter sp. FW80]